MHWCPQNLRKNVIMLDVINKATSISCYFILSMYFIDNICTLSANIKFICTFVSILETEVEWKSLLCRAFPSCFEMSTNNQLISGHCINVRHVCKSCPIYTLKGKTLGIVVDFPQSNVYSAVYARPVSLAQ
jgi:hypothetical protein